MKRIYPPLNLIALLSIIFLSSCMNRKFELPPLLYNSKIEINSDLKKLDSLLMIMAMELKSVPLQSQEAKDIAGKMFRKMREQDYIFFLMRYRKYILPIADTFCYCLLPNHFHLLIKIKDQLPDEKLEPYELFRRLFISYSMYFNKLTGRTGTLVERRYKRVEVTKMDYLKYLVFYIHYNPQKHKYSKDFKSYEYSSYKGLLSPSLTLLHKEEVLAWFNNSVDEFVEFHQVLHNERKIIDYIIER